MLATTSVVADAVTLLVPVETVVRVSRPVNVVVFAATPALEVTATFSIPVTVEPAGVSEVTAATAVSVRLSVPAPPSILSSAVSVCTPAVVLATIESSPAPPVTLSRPVVSELVQSFINPLFLLEKRPNFSM
jgi:hypothetical protein